MNSSTARWTVTAAAAALLALPGAVTAQTPPATQPPATAQPSQPPADAAQPASQNAALEHLRQAKAALDDIGPANLSSRARTQVAELKKRVANLERMTASTGKVTAAKEEKNTRVSRTAANWGTEVAAADKVVTTLLGVSPNETAATTSKPATAAAIDDATKAKLTEFRTHLTAFATAMSGQAPAAAATPDPASPTTSAPPTEPTQPPATAQPPTTQPPATQPPATAQPPATPPAQATDPAAPKVDTEAAKRHLTEARNTLSQLTQLPAAAQLAGDARTQVTQLITNFNELITTQSNWPAAYAKVNSNLTALLGPENVAPSPSGTPGAVGTAGGGITLDPAVREKLVELRKHLSEFERASGGGASRTPDAAPPSDPAPATPSKPATEPASPPAAAAPMPAAAASDALTHLAAIETLLKMQNDSGGLTLDKAQVELLRTHLAELRKALEKK